MKKRITVALLAALILSSVSCGGETPDVTDETTPADTTTEAVDEYKYENNYGGRDFNILGTIDIYSMHMEFDRDEQNGEALNDAIYNRNRLVEQKLNIKINETKVDKAGAINKTVAEYIRQSVEADDYLYDLTFIAPPVCAPYVRDGYFYDLKDYEGFQLDREWYNHSYNSDMELGGKLYYGMSDATVGLTDGLWVLFFNEDMTEKLGLEKPYDLVREGKWTLDRLKEYLAAAANLNGDDDFNWDQNGKAVYGLSMMPYCNYYFLRSFGEKMVENKNDELVFTAGSEHFMNAVDKLYAINDPTLGLLHKSEASDFDLAGGGYITAFMNQRALFLTSEVSKSQNFRDLNFMYGMIPFPKLDETQEKYATNVYQGALAFSIPVSCKTPEETAVIFDALAYEGKKSVVPVYRSVTVEQKGLRNEDSIEMLGIVTESVSNDIGLAYGLFGGFIGSIYGDVSDRKGTMASLIESYKTSIGAELEKINNER